MNFTYSEYVTPWSVEDIEWVGLILLSITNRIVEGIYATETLKATEIVIYGIER